jgi:acetolactate decarboxylase
MSLKKYLITFILCSLFFQASFLMAAEPFNLRYYGSFKKMMHMVRMKKVVGVVDLKRALSGPHTYAVGAIRGGKGEITVIDNEIWLAYGNGGLGRIKRRIPGGEQASLVVTAQVRDWQEITVPKQMSEPQLHDFIVKQAERYGLNTKKPFPFLIKGPFQDVKWHVINGLNPEFTGHFKGHGGKPPFIQLKEHIEQTSGVIIGFYSADVKGVFTHPGESWHLHILIRDKERAGHVDEVVVGKGAVLKLPEI